MKKTVVFGEILITGMLLAGIYGILHDQVTYTIAPEYYTKFKFIQFRLNPEQFSNIRSAVAVVGFLATYWTGIIIGIVLGLTGFIFKDHKKMRTSVRKAFLVTFCVAIVTGFVGYLYGTFILADIGVNWWLPSNLVDKRSFIVVGSIHNFSYLGGLLGMIAGIVYLVWKKKAMPIRDNLPSEQL